MDKDGYRVDNDGKAIYDFQVNHDGVLAGGIRGRKLRNINFCAGSAAFAFVYLKIHSFPGSGEHSANDSFAETYGLGLGEGESKRFVFSFEGRDNGISISTNSRITSTILSTSVVVSKVMPS